MLFGADEVLGYDARGILVANDELPVVGMLWLFVEAFATGMLYLLPDTGPLADGLPAPVALYRPLDGGGAVGKTTLGDGLLDAYLAGDPAALARPLAPLP